MTLDLTFDAAQPVAHLRAHRDSIGLELAALVAHWNKYSTRYHDDPAAFAQLETHSLVDYIALLLETKDDSFRHLYVGEKAKQFYDLSVTASERASREEDLLAGERKAFINRLADYPEAHAFVEEVFDQIVHALTGEATAEVKALFIGDCLYLDVISFLTAPAMADGVRLRPSFVTTHDAGEIRAQIAKLADERFDVVFYSPFTYALLSDYEALQRPRSLTNPLRLTKHIKAAVANALDIFDVVADLFDCPIVAHAPAPIIRSDGSLKERIASALTLPSRQTATRKLARALRDRAEARNARGSVVHVVEEHVVAAGRLKAAGRYLFRSRLQHPAAFGAMLAPVYADIVMVIARLRKRKVVVCDLDNTLWHGVVGEGLGITHHYDRQAPLLTLKSRGVVLAINSKNDPAKAVWDAPEGRLCLEDFVSRQINWDPKPINMRRIAQHLNLKEKDFVFIDDRADERAVVRDQFPALLTLDALDPRSWRLLQLWAELLPAKPGADRTDFYRQRDARQAFIAAEVEVNEAERANAFQQLDLRLVVREAREGDVDRVTDLINRTNQFNTTGSRVTKRQIAEWVESDDAWVLIADATDRFGPMGTISVLVAERSPDTITIPIFVLSCRVFGYGMEFAILEQARRLARNGEAVFAELIETPYNQPCQEVYATAGFARHEGGWRLPKAEQTSIPFGAWLKLELPQLEPT